VSNGGSPRSVVGRQRADTALREGRALSVLATRWDVGCSLDTRWSNGESFDTRCSLAVCWFLVSR